MHLHFNKISRKILVGLAAAAVFFVIILFQNRISLSEEIKNILVGLFSSLLVVLLIEIINLVHESTLYQVWQENIKD